MSEMATCPECGQPVTVGGGLTDSTEVRCPLCEAEFAASSATDLATDTDPDGDSPPEVIPVTADGEETSSTPDSPGELEAGVQTTETAESSEEPGEPAAEEADVRARCPCCNAEFGLDEVLLTTTGEPLGREAVGAITAEGHKELPGFAGPTTRDGAPRFDIDLGNPAGPAVSDGAFDLVTDGDDDAEGASASTAAFGRRRPKEKSLMREFIGIVLGGVAGLAIAYYGLNFFGGSRFDFLGVYLPGIEHTSGHRPSWLPGGNATEADLKESELED